MASISGVAGVNKIGMTRSWASKQSSIFIATYHEANKLKIQQNARISSSTFKSRGNFQDFGLLKSVQSDVFTTSDDEDEMSQGFLEAIEELERMAREPSDVLEEMNAKLSARELQLVLVYFAQDGRDSWCTLEVFEWLKKENRVDKETMELMVSIMCTWVKKLIEGKSKVEEVVDLLMDMNCVGLNTNFSMIEKVISLYWEFGQKEDTLLFVKEVLKRGISCSGNGDKDGNEGGPAGYLAWKMMEEGSYVEAAKFVIHLRESGLKPEVYSYLIAMTAVVKELNELAKALSKLKTFAKSNLVAELDIENIKLIENYQENLLSDGHHLSYWAIREGGPAVQGVVHERLLAMYICAGHGGDAEQQLWNMKLAGKEADGDIYDIVLAICASRKETKSVGRLLARMEVMSLFRRKKTLSWLLRGYIKGGHFKNAAETVVKMLDFGLYPEFLHRVAVLQGLSRKIQLPGNVDAYLTLCKRLSDANLIDPCLLYMHLRKHNLWIIKML